MKSAKLRTRSAPARLRRASMTSGGAWGFMEAFIYKDEPMDTLSAMFKRILVLLAAAAAGIAVYVGAMRLSASWTLFPNRELDRSSGYVREVLKIVHENYVDAAAST